LVFPGDKWKIHGPNDVTRARLHLHRGGQPAINTPIATRRYRFDRIRCSKKVAYTSYSPLKTWAQREKTNFWELYNTDEDPAEQRNLAFIRKDITQRVRDEMKQLRRQFSVSLPITDAPPPARPDPEAIEALRALGYME
jgi:hypothetical protein